MSKISSMKNAFTIDVEDWFHGIELKQDEWKGKEYRLEKGLNTVLQLMNSAGVKGTFFTLGWIAKNYPHIIRQIDSENHELASHGYSHEKVYDLSHDAFREEVSITKKLIEDITGKKMKGYRAPFFSITSSSLWALKILSEEGYTYDCSINPVKTWRYGISTSPDYIYSVNDASIVEFPVSTFPLLHKRMAVGGAYFRIFPFMLTSNGVKSKNKKNEPVNFYAHPWEYDPGHPVIESMERKARFTHYFNLKAMTQRTAKLLREFEFTTASDVIDEISKNKLPNVSLNTLSQG